MRQARGKSFSHGLLEIATGRVAWRNFEFWKGVANFFDFDIAAFGNRKRARKRVRELTEDPRHFRGSLEIKLVGRKLHSMRVADRLTRLDAKKHILGVRVLMGQVMAIIGSHKRYA